MLRARPGTVALVLALAGYGFGPLPAALAASTPPADLRLEWAGAEAPIAGRAGETVRLRFRLRNVGGDGAFAAVLAAATALGPQGAPERIQPGPGAGESLARSLRLPLAEGMRELCIDAALQRPRPEDPGDPNLGDNRICRPVRVRAAGDGAERGRGAAGPEGGSSPRGDPGDPAASGTDKREPAPSPRTEGSGDPSSRSPIESEI